jgi:2-polyprenyl-6-methoxyphenol hydroxylase-like FAD-dependent oxidoreductase
MRIAISGCGIAGPTLAYWLLRAGHQPTLIEVAPALRASGYMIDFWGVGYDVADRMGLLPKIRETGYDLAEVRYLDARGRTAATISARTLSRELGDRFTSLPRGDLASILHQSVADEAETVFDDSIAALSDLGGAVGVHLASGAEREFDLVIGADGLHSNVRALAYGAETEFERPLGYYVGAFECAGYAPRDELAYVSCGVPGRQISRFALRGDRTMFLLVFAAELLAGAPPKNLDERWSALADVFGGMGWEWPTIERALATAPEIYFDRVSQIVTTAWSRGRVALVGDAAACVSLVAGEGTGLAMTEAYVLAGELACDEDYERALRSYESRLRRFVQGKQKSARSFAASFTPRTAFGVWLRNQAVQLMALPGMPDLLVGAQMRDDFDLPHYA